MLRKNLGITLLSLVITIVILLILAGTATFTGIDAIGNSKITTFRTEMEMMRLQLNSASELDKYKKTESDVLSESQEDYLSVVQNALNEDGLSITLDIEGFKYFTKEEIKTMSNTEISRNLYINATTKTIVSDEGVKYDGKLYYMLEQLPNSLYNVEQNIQNSGEVTFNVTYDKLNIIVSNIEYTALYVEKGTVQYKLSTAEKWTTVAENTVSKNLTFQVPSYGEYDIRVIDAKGNELISKIELQYNGI